MGPLPIAATEDRATSRFLLMETDARNQQTSRSSLTEREAAFVLVQRVARLATQSAGGSPHVMPICYAFDGTRFYTPLDEKPKRVADAQLRRVRNIQARPDVGLLIDQYDDDWSQLGYVLVRGRAELIDPGNSTHAHALALLRQRYPQYRAMALERRQIIAITPVHVTSWGPAVGT